MTKQETAN